MQNHRLPGPVPAAIEAINPMAKSSLSGVALAGKNSSELATVLTAGTITVNIQFRGQSTIHGAISPLYWLRNFNFVNAVLICYKRSEEIGFPLNTDIVHVRVPGSASTERYVLNTRVHRLAPPRGSGPLVWGELVAGLVKILEQVTTRAKFEQVNALILKDGGEVAFFQVYLDDHPTLTQESAETA